jgi:hypothetical protein
MLLIRLGLIAVAALLALPTATSFAKASPALPCLTLAQAKAKHQHPRYRDVDERRCWYVGRRVPAKSEFSLPATASSRGEGVKSRPKPDRLQINRMSGVAGVAPGPRENNHAGGAPGPSTLAAEYKARASESRRGEPAPPGIVWPDPAAVMWEWAPVDTATLIALVCGGLCQIPPLDFEQRWRIGT